MESCSSPANDHGRGLIAAEKSESSLLNNTSEDQSKTTEPVAKTSIQDMFSSLSVNAEPFTSVNQSEKSQLSVMAKEFVPLKPAVTEFYAQPEATLEDYGEQYSETEKTDPLLEYAFQVLSEITFSPGHFSHLCDQLVSTLKNWPTLDEMLLQILIDEIISQAVREPNFRYNGARLCNSISRELMTGPGLPDFRALLFNSCKMIHNERKNLMQSDAEYLRGFALFMSELFVHMSPKEGTGKFRILGIAVRELLQTLLSHPTPGNVKCLCQILKLSGSYIEDDDRASHKGKAIEMDMLMTNIDTVARTVDMQMHMKDLLRNVIELRDSDWGRASTSPVNSHENIHQHPPPTSMTPQVAQMGVYYGPDGQALTAEETEFLDQGMRRHEDEDEYDYHDDEDTGMDDEMAEAFEKFLMMQEALK